MYQRILVALSEEAAINDKVMAEAIAIAQATHGTLNLLRVLFPPSSGFPQAMYLTADGMHSTVTADSFQLYLNDWQTLQHDNQKELDTLANQVSTQGVLAEWTQAISDPGRQICQVAQAWPADLIMMGRHSRSGVEEFLVGSVSNYVMHHAPCAVITVQGIEIAATAV